MLIIVSFIIGSNACKQTQPTTGGGGKRLVDTLTLAFYNVENLFDAENDPQKQDEDFLPDGAFKWTRPFYEQKSSQLAKAISAMDAEQGPDLLGVAEVENRRVLEDLVRNKELAARRYAIVHEESPDIRGIDVALLYDPATFTYVRHKAIPIQVSGEITRDVLLVEGTVRGENLFVVVNHWPSRRGEQDKSEDKRLDAARQVRTIIDSLLSLVADANIAVMGDFNDDPFNRSMSEILKGKKEPKSVATGEFFNPMAGLHHPDTLGSLWYQGKWNLFDQILLSQGLLDNKKKLVYLQDSEEVFHPKMLRVGYGSAKEAPRRSIFRGEFVKEGFSDHFPVYVKLGVGK